MKTTILIPVYNEGENIRNALAAIREKVRGDYQISIVYDFDEDTTLPALDAAEKDLGIAVRRIRNRYGRGVLNAIRSGFECADSEYVVVTMADLSDPPEVINDMVGKADAEQADIVCASRYMRGGRQTGGPFLKGLMSRCAGLSLHLLAGLPVHDPTNSFKLYRKSFLDRMTIESTGGFELGIELVVKAWKSGFKVVEVPTAWTDRVCGKSNFQLRKWLPHYLHWYFAAFIPASWNHQYGKQQETQENQIRTASFLLFFLFLAMHLPGLVSLGTGLDPSWIRILNLAHESNLQFGKDVIFTYGPLGYLLFPIDPDALLSASFTSLFFAFPFWILFVRKRSLTDYLCLFCFVCSTVFCTTYEVFMLLLPLLILRYAEEKNLYVKYAGILYCSIAGALAVQVKFMAFPTVLLCVILADIMLWRQKRLILAFPAGVLMFFFSWYFLAKQDPGNILSFFYYSMEISRGYNDAMFCDFTSVLWIPFSFLIAVYIFVIVFLGMNGGNWKNWKSRLTLPNLMLAGALFFILFLTYKYFVLRCDTAHISAAMRLFSVIAVFCAVNYSFLNSGSRFALLLLFPVSLLLSFYLFGNFSIDFMVFRTNYFVQIYLYATFLFFVFQMRTWCRFRKVCISALLLLLILFTGHCFYLELMTQQKKALDRNAFFVASRSASSMDADCFAHDILMLLQSGAEYSPRFVFQSYSAYTPALLKKNAEHFLYENAPDYLFCGKQEIDGRLPSSLDSPSLLQILNIYQVIASEGPLENTVLKKKETRPQAPALRELSTVSCGFHSPIPVPASSRLIWMTAEIRQTLPGLLLKYAVRPVAVNVRLTLDNGETLVHRIIPTCSQVPFLISPYLDTWENLSSLFADQCPRVVQISFSPIFRFTDLDLKHWERRVGALAYKDKITVHFFESSVPSDQKEQGD